MPELVGKDRPLAVLGAGPVGLVAALRARQLGFVVDVYEDFDGDEDGRAPCPMRLESVPAQFVALMVEFNVDPRDFGVEALHTRRAMQWSDGLRQEVDAPSAAHLARPALEMALRSRAERCGIAFRRCRRSDIDDLQAAGRTHDLLLVDASGRAAITAGCLLRPEKPIVARLFFQPSGPRPCNPHLMIAAGPEGYAYRLGSALGVTVGLVGRGAFIAGDAECVISQISAFAPWFAHGLSAKDLQAGSSGAASLQCCLEGNGAAVRVGDASLARDALASQGLAQGISDALRKVGALAHPEGTPRPDGSKLARHCWRVIEQIERSPFRLAPHWTRYGSFLSQLASGRSKRAEATGPIYDHLDARTRHVLQKA